MTSMDTRRLALLAALILVLSALTPLVAADSHEDNSDGQPDETPDGDDADGDNDNRTAGDEGQARAEQARLMGQLSYEDGAASGAFVSFHFDESTGTVSDWTYEDTAVIDSLSFETFELADLRVHGSTFLALNGQHNESAEDGNDTADDNMADGNDTADDGDDAAAHRVRLQLHDNPTGFIKIGLHDANTVTWTIADGITVDQTSNWTIELSADGFHAFLWKDRAANESGFDVSGQTISLDVAEQAQVMYRVSPAADGADGDGEADPEAAERGRAIAQAAMDGKVGMELAMDVVNGTPAADVVSFDGIEAETRGEPGRVDVEMTFDGPAKTVVVKVGKDLVNASDPADVEVLFDGEAIPPADDLDDVLDPTDDDGPEFLVVIGSSGAEVLVSVDEWSTHTVTVQEAGDAVTPVPAPGLIALLAALVGATAVVHVLRRRDG